MGLKPKGARHIRASARFHYERKGAKQRRVATSRMRAWERPGPPLISTLTFTTLTLNKYIVQYSLV